MKKLSLILTVIVVLTIGTFNIASAKPGKVNPEQAKKQQVTTKAKVAPGQSKKTVTKTLPTVIKIGRLQLPVNPIVKDLGAEVVWPGGKVITITKDTSVITITIVADGKKSTVVEINSTVSGVAAKKVLTQKGNGVINPTSYIKSLLKTVPTPALALINAATSVQIFASVFTGNAAALKISLAEYNALDATHQGRVVAIVYNDGIDYTTVAAFKTAFEAAVAAQQLDTATLVAVAEVNVTTDAVACGAVVVKNAIALGLTLTDYTALDSSHKTAVNTAVWNGGTDYTSAAFLKTTFDAAVVVQKADQAAEQAATDLVNAATLENMQKVLLTNATALGLDLTAYNALTTPQAALVGTYVFAAKGTNYANAAAVKFAFDVAVTAAKTVH